MESPKGLCKSRGIVLQKLPKTEPFAQSQVKVRQHCKSGDMRLVPFYRASMQAEVLQTTQGGYANSTREGLRKYGATISQLQLGDVL